MFISNRNSDGSYKLVAIPLDAEHLVPYEYEIVRRYPNNQTMEISYNYEKIGRNLFNTGITEELLRNRFAPGNMPKFSGWGFGSFYDFDTSDYDDCV
jgi:hypothetical protein